MGLPSMLVELLYVINPNARLISDEQEDPGLRINLPSQALQLAASRDVRIVLDAFSHPRRPIDFLAQTTLQSGHETLLRELVFYDVLIPKQFSSTVRRGTFRTPVRSTFMVHDREQVPRTAPVFFGCPFDFAQDPPYSPIGGPMAVRHHLTPEAAVEDVGDVIHTPNEGLFELGKRVAHISSKFSSMGRRFVMVGGDHSLTTFAVKGLTLSTPNFGVVQFDAHSDLHLPRPRNASRRPHVLNHSNFMTHVARLKNVAFILQCGLRDSQLNSVPTFDIKDADVSQIGVPSLRAPCNLFSAVLKDLPQLPVYLTIDVDVLDPMDYPAVSTPLPGGLTADDLLCNVQACMDHLNVVALDIVELCSPGPRGVSREPTAAVAAQLINLALSRWEAIDARRDKHRS